MWRKIVSSTKSARHNIHTQQKLTFKKNSIFCILWKKYENMGQKRASKCRELEKQLDFTRWSYTNAIPSSHKCFTEVKERMKNNAHFFKIMIRQNSFYIGQLKPFLLKSWNWNLPSHPRRMLVTRQYGVDRTSSEILFLLGYLYSLPFSYKLIQATILVLS